MNRRPDPRFNRGRIATAAGNSAPPAFSPSDISGLVSWFDSESGYNTDTGDGTATTAMTDRGSAGANMAEGGAGLGPLRLDPGSNRRGSRLVVYTAGKWARTANATLAAVPGNTPADFSVVQVYQPISNASSYRAGWGRTTTTTNYHTIRRGPNTYTNQVAQRDNVVNNSAGITLGVPDGFMPQVAINVFNSGASTMQQYVDGAQIASVTLNRGATVLDQFAEGALPSSVPTLQSSFRRRHTLVYNRQLDAGEIEQITTWGCQQWGVTGTNMRWKSGSTEAATFGNGSGEWVIFACVGGSQGGGRGTTGYTSVYAGTSDQSYCLYNDNNLAPIAEPTSSTADVVGGQLQDNAGQVGTSAWTRFVDRLRELGETRNIMFVNIAASGITSAAYLSNLTTSPPAANSLSGVAKYRLSEALKAPNSVIGGIIFTQGEANSLPYLDGTVAWGSYADEMNTYFAGRFDKTTHFVFMNLAVTPWTSANPVDWAQVRTDIAALAAGRTDMVVAQWPSGPYTLSDNLHLETGSNSPGAETGLMGGAISAADAWWAAS